MKRIIIIFPVLLVCMVMGVSAGVNGSVVYGQTVETGTGDKGPDNPYEITGYLPDAVTVKDGGTTTVYGIPDDISPLFGDGVIWDEYDAATGIETRRWKRVELDGTESGWFSSPAGDTFTLRYALPTSDVLSPPTVQDMPDITCTHYKTDTPNNIYYGAQGVTINAGNIIFLDTAYGSQGLAAWKSYLASQKAAGTPVTVVYQLANPLVIHHTPVILSSDNPGTDVGFLAGVSGASGFLGQVFTGLFDVVSRYRIALAAVGLPLLVYILGCIISMVQRHSVFEVAGWRDTGFVGAIKRYRMRQEDKKKQAFATRIFRQNENLDVQYVDIDGQRYYRDHRSRRYKVRLGDRAADYYNPRGDDVPVYDGKRQTRKKG